VRQSPAIARSRRVFAAALWLAFVCGAAPSWANTEKVTWTPVRDAMFTIDSKPVKLWTLYHAGKDKKEHRLLLQLGTRYLMIDTQLRLITEYDPSAFEKKGGGYDMPRDAKGLRALGSEDWILRDMGTSYLIHAKLKDEGRLLEINLPKMPDFRNFLW